MQPQLNQQVANTQLNDIKHNLADLFVLSVTEKGEPHQKSVRLNWHVKGLVS